MSGSISFWGCTMNMALQMTIATHGFHASLWLFIGTTDDDEEICWWSRWDTEVITMKLSYGRCVNVGPHCHFAHLHFVISLARWPMYMMVVLSEGKKKVREKRKSGSGEDGHSWSFMICLSRNLATDWLMYQNPRARRTDPRCQKLW